MTKNVLVVDDDGQAVASLVRALGARLEGVTIDASTSAAKALILASQLHPSVAVIDLDLGTGEGPEAGFKLLQALLAFDPILRIVVLTGHHSVEFGVRALNAGAAHFIEKPADIAHLAALVRDGFKQAELRRNFEDLQAKEVSRSLSELVGESQAVKTLREEVRYAASSNHPVLIVGETGTGKGVCARLIHQLGLGMASRPFIRCQPSYGQHDLVASELFGHKKGSFTGAQENRTGLLHDADGGTLFIDEVQELPVETQVMLLDSLQEKRFRPIGSNSYQKSEFRLISATNVPVNQALSQGKLRQDFYHRIAFNEIVLSPLRERKEDIRALVKLFLSGMQQHDVSSVSVSEKALELLERNDWPGNIRELQATIETAAHRAQFHGRRTIDESDLRIRGRPQELNEARGFHEQIEEFKMRLIQDALKRNQGNQVRAAEELGIDRGTIRRLTKIGTT